jgi:hypothetical protein
MQTTITATLFLIRTVAVFSASSLRPGLHIKPKNTVPTAMRATLAGAAIFLIVVLIVATLKTGLGGLKIPSRDSIAAHGFRAVHATTVVVIRVAIIAFLAHVLNAITAAIKGTTKTAFPHTQAGLTGFKAWFTGT